MFEWQIQMRMEEQKKQFDFYLNWLKMILPVTWCCKNEVEYEKSGSSVESYNYLMKEHMEGVH